MEEKLQVYQGGPLVGTLEKKIGDIYVEDLSDLHIEALLTPVNGATVKTWDSDDGTIVFDQVTTQQGTLKGVAIFRMTGGETAKLAPGLCTLEVAISYPDGRAIEVKKSVIEIKPARIREGV